MITKFDSSYYGTADMENLGYLGTPINDRYYPQAQFAKALHKVVAYAKCMDERGYTPSGWPSIISSPKARN